MKSILKLTKNPQFCRHLLVLGGYFFLTLIFLWPITTHIQQRFPGEGTDAYVYAWANQWFHQQFPTKSVFYTDQVLAPEGYNLIFHSHVFGNAFLSLPIGFLDPVTRINLLIMFSFVLAGYSSYLLVKHFQFSCATAFIVGMINAFNSFRMAHLDHLNFLNIGWLILFVLCAFRLKEHGNKMILAMIAIVTMLVYSSYYFAFYLFAILPIIYAFQIVYENKDWRRYTVQWVKIFSVLAILLLPILLGMVEAKNKGQWIETPDGGFADFYSPDLLFFVLPSPDHFLWGDTVANWYEKIRGNQIGEHHLLKGIITEFVVHPGYISLIFAALTLYYYRLRNKHINLFLVIFAITFIFLLGTQLSIAGQYLIPMPGKVLMDIPFLQSFRVPGRLAPVCILFLSLIAAFAIEKWCNGNRVKWIIVGLLAVFEMWPSIPWKSAEIPSGYQEIIQDQEPSTVIEVPFGVRSGFGFVGLEDSRFMLYAAKDGKKRFGGMLARIDDKRMKEYANFPVLRTLLIFQRNLSGNFRQNPLYSKQALIESITADKKLAKFFYLQHKVKYIVIHPDSLAKHYNEIMPDKANPQIIAALVQHLRNLAFQDDGKTWGKVIIVNNEMGIQ